jgi:hypothetical protein
MDPLSKYLLKAGFPKSGTPQTKSSVYGMVFHAFLLKNLSNNELRKIIEVAFRFLVRFDSSGGMTTAAATLSSESRSRSFTPDVLRPAERTDLVSMRMILPNWLMTMSSLASSTRLLPGTLPTLG